MHQSGENITDVLPVISPTQHSLGFGMLLNKGLIQEHMNN